MCALDRPPFRGSAVGLLRKKQKDIFGSQIVSNGGITDVFPYKNLDGVTANFDNINIDPATIRDPAIVNSMISNHAMSLFTDGSVASSEIARPSGGAYVIVNSLDRKVAENAFPSGLLSSSYASEFHALFFGVQELIPKWCVNKTLRGGFSLQQIANPSSKDYNARVLTSSSKHCYFSFSTGAYDLSYFGRRRKKKKMID